MGQNIPAGTNAVLARVSLIGDANGFQTLERQRADIVIRAAEFAPDSEAGSADVFHRAAEIHMHIADLAPRVGGIELA